MAKKQWYLDTMDYYSAIRKKKIIDESQGESKGEYAKWKEPIQKGYILYDSTYITLLKRQNYKHGRQISDC